jgi:hypothetical protein
MSAFFDVHPVLEFSTENEWGQSEGYKRTIGWGEYLYLRTYTYAHIPRSIYLERVY